jgi:hypothetical protein
MKPLAGTAWFAIANCRATGMRAEKNRKSSLIFILYRLHGNQRRD